MTAIKMPEFSAEYYNKFWGKVKITANPNKCWEWDSTKDKDGYGFFRNPLKSKTTYLRANRVSFYLTNHIDPNEFEVCHKCDNPSCVNPSHLFLGTTKDNAIDRMRKGRNNAARGENHGTHTKPNSVRRGEDVRASKLTEKQVIEIKKLYAAGNILQRELGKMYGVTQKTISKIIIGHRWKHIII